MQSIWFCSKKGHPIQFALDGVRCATGKHLKANDLIKASQASPLTRCIKAICWLLNKRIIFYLDFCCVHDYVQSGSRIQVEKRPQCECVIRVVTLWAFYQGSFSFICVWAASAAAVVKHAGLHKPLHVVLGMLLSLQVNKWKHIKGIVHLSQYNPQCWCEARGAWKCFFVASASNAELFFILISDLFPLEYWSSHT